jgi:Mn-dependent DtxR family transcriptional regulator
MEIILRMVNVGDGPTIKELIERMGVNPTGVYESTNRLRKLGLVRRFPGGPCAYELHGQGVGSGRIPYRIWPTRKGRSHDPI